MYRKYIKHIIDWCGALALLVLLTPLMTFIAIILYFTNNRKIFFVQERAGHNGRSFKLIKFATMADAVHFITSNDVQRITSVGRFLRKYSIDELPQLINVLKGDLSLIGPRPLLKEYLPLYNSFQCRRHEVRPGITGLAQVCGRNSLSWDQKFTYDVQYVQELSWKLDLKIIMLTLKQLVYPTGVNAGQEQTMEKFKGNSL